MSFPARIVLKKKIVCTGKGNTVLSFWGSDHKTLLIASPKNKAVLPLPVQTHSVYSTFREGNDRTIVTFVAVIQVERSHRGRIMARNGTKCSHPYAVLSFHVLPTVLIQVTKLINDPVTMKGTQSSSPLCWWKVAPGPGSRIPARCPSYQGWAPHSVAPHLISATALEVYIPHASPPIPVSMYYTYGTWKSQPGASVAVPYVTWKPPP